MLVIPKPNIMAPCAKTSTAVNSSFWCPSQQPTKTYKGGETVRDKEVSTGVRPTTANLKEAVHFKEQ